MRVVNVAPALCIACVFFDTVRMLPAPVERVSVGATALLLRGYGNAACGVVRCGVWQSQPRRSPTDRNPHPQKHVRSKTREQEQGNYNYTGTLHSHTEL